jgi:hypothetical protein
LTLKILSKNKEKYAWYRGWFKDYTGVLREEYREDKDLRMKTKALQFKEKYGDDENIDRGKAVKMLGVNRMTVDKYTKLLEKDVDYVMTVTGRYKFTPNGFEKLKNLMINKNFKENDLKVTVDE